MFHTYNCFGNQGILQGKVSIFFAEHHRMLLHYNFQENHFQLDFQDIPIRKVYIQVYTYIHHISIQNLVYEHSDRIYSH